MAEKKGAVIGDPEIPYVEQPAPVVDKTPPAVDTDLLVERWFMEHFPNSPASRDTRVWNQLVRAKDELKRRLACCPRQQPGAKE